MALPAPNIKLAKKKPVDGLDDLVTARMPMKPAATSSTAVNEVAKPVADAARQGKTVGSGSGVPTRPSSGKGPAADPLDDLARERMAAEAEIDASNARQQMDARSRAGLGGLGLSGGAQAGAGDLARQQARTKALTMADFDKMAEDRAFTDVQRDAAILDYEDTYDRDLDGDGFVAGEKVGGKIGDGDIENDPDKKPADAEDAKRALDEAKALLPTQDLYVGDPDTAGGTKEEPYQFGSMAEFAEWFRETTGMEPDLETTDYGQHTNAVVFVDQFGNYYSVPRAGQR